MDDINFGGHLDSLIMKTKFKMSMVGKLTFFLGSKFIKVKL